MSILVGSDWDKHSYLLAISGGRDSMVLLDIVSSVISRQQVTVAHFNHRIRGEESDRDEEFTIAQAKARNLIIQVGRAKKHQSSEEALRNDRRLFLQNVKSQVSADYIITAHHATDQLETMFMRLIRGTGLSGLRGIPSHCDSFIRPLLTISRDEIDHYVECHQLPFREDSSNQSSQFLRNRIRHNVVQPLMDLTGDYGGPLRWAERFSSLQDELYSVNNYLELQSQNLFSNLCLTTPFWVVMEVSRFTLLSAFEKTLLLRKIYSVLLLPPPDRKKLDRIVRSIEQGGRALSAQHALRVELSCGFLFFRTKSQELKLANVSSQVLSSGKSFNSAGLGIELLRTGVRSGEQLEFRFYQQGDHYLGKKMKRLFLDRRIPRLERSIVPVLAHRDSKEILWFLPELDRNISVKRLDFPYTFALEQWGEPQHDGDRFGNPGSSSH